MGENKNGVLNQREMLYGERLGKMIRCETISSSFHQDLSKFYKFHEILEELFPNIHKTCEKHEVNGRSASYSKMASGTGSTASFPDG